MEDYIPISVLNDFIFCPYSIYLHNVYVESDEGIYQATPQTRGRIAHESTDNKTYSTSKDNITALTVYSEYFGLVGKIDLYRKAQKLLVEKKFKLKKIYRGQLYQLWAQYFCMKEMGYEVENLAFYEISTNKMIPISMPGAQEKSELQEYIKRFLAFSPEVSIDINPIKCSHCIYCNLCDKTDYNNVYT